MSVPAAPAAAAPEKQENMLLNLVFSIALPSFLLVKLSKPERLGPVWGLVIALAFPVGYGVFDLCRRRKVSFFNVVGIVSVLLTGGLGLFQVAAIWIAVKEAAVPLIFGIAVLGSQWTATPLVRSLLYNDKFLDTAKVAAALAANGSAAEFDRLLARTAWLLAGSFFLSAATNFLLAQYLLKSAPGTPEFNAEMGRMLAWSWPVNVLPSLLITALAMYLLFRGIKRLTGLTMEEVFREPPKPAGNAQA